MPVPDYQTLMLPLLRAIAEGATSVADCLPRLRGEFSISEDDASALTPSGRTTILASRAHWARTYLSKAGLLSSPARNVHEITDLGRQVLSQSPARIDNDFLARFDGFHHWRTRGHETAIEGPPVQHELAAPSSETPEELIARAHAELHGALADELLTLMQDMKPARFEHLILDLLKSMGYGAGSLGSLHTTPVTGDGGIDGIIHEDALGLDAVYIQAKRYAADNKVSRPAIQQFVGSLTGEGATKGVFVTTSDFSREAREYLRKVQHRIVLIGGRELAELMVRHGIGVRTRQTYEIKGVDEDYFSESGAI
ncbi:MAG: restriction endonuclease [Proteobacteria bacterium]|nr:restriction endonuclease [Pseudomonadota bacterium]